MASSSDSRQNPPNSCVHCWEPTTKRCVKCYKASQQQVFYCSQKCQRMDWTDHKHFCALPFPEKKLEKSVYAILLREEATKPEVVEVPLRHSSAADVSQFISYPSTMNVIKNYYKDFDGNFPNNPRFARRLRNMLCIEYNDTLLIDGSAPNKCIQTITANKAPHPWAGPMIVYKGKGASKEPFLTEYELNDLHYEDAIQIDWRVKEDILTTVRTLYTNWGIILQHCDYDKLKDCHVNQVQEEMENYEKFFESLGLNRLLETNLDGVKKVAEMKTKNKLKRTFGDKEAKEIITSWKSRDMDANLYAKFKKGLEEALKNIYTKPVFDQLLWSYCLRKHWDVSLKF